MREGGGRGAKRGRSDGSSVMYGVILPVVTHTHEPLRAFHAEPRPPTPHPSLPVLVWKEWRQRQGVWSGRGRRNVERMARSGFSFVRLTTRALRHVVQRFGSIFSLGSFNILFLFFVVLPALFPLASRPTYPSGIAGEFCEIWSESGMSA